MSRNGKVVVAMSGGVDSSVAACLLKEQGYDCLGVFMRVGVQAEPADGWACETRAPRPANLRHGCCSASDAADARTVAGTLGIPFYALNFRDDFERIIGYFVDEYARGRTPNPCVQCNIQLKFGKLLRYADMVGAEFVATGHYARTPSPGGGPARLMRAVNQAKDQSYVLFGIERAALPRCRFPLGEFADKAAVRGIAAQLGLPVHDKPDSQEICFVPDQDYKRLVHERRPETRRPGALRDQGGRVLGTHDGVASFTIGQRRGLGVALGQPAYVTHLDVLSNTVTLGTRDDLLARGLETGPFHWLVDPPPGRQRAQIKIRYQHVPAAGQFEARGDGSVAAWFDQPQSAVTPGQAAVLYDGEVVLGGGWIERTARE